VERVNNSQMHLVANAARVKEGTSSRFRRPKSVLQDKLPTVKSEIKPRYERGTTFPVTKTSRFARPKWGTPQNRTRQPNINSKTKSKKVKQRGRGCLLLWPRSMLNEAEELFQIARKKSKDSDNVVALLAIPVSITIA